MPSLAALRKRLGDIEEKVVRRVRTAEGAARYGQPIGSIITRDKGKRKLHLDKHRQRRQEMSAALDSGDYVPVSAKRIEKREYANFWDYYEGVYGVDWTWGKESGKLLDGSPESRKKLAIKESRSLGISVNSHRNMKVDTAAHETINALCRTMEEMYPGFNEYAPNYNLDLDYIGSDGQNRWLAYNRMHTAYYGKGLPPLEVPGADGYSRDWSHTSIGLSSKWFGQGFDEHSIGISVRTSMRDRWWSTHTDALDRSERETWEFAQLVTLSHEQGHTIARMCIGEMASEAVPHGDIAPRFLQELRDVLDYYGASTHNGETYADAPGYDYRGKAEGYLQLNKFRVMSHVSQYGATNLHELLAECWAGYMMDDRPTEFVTDVGALMEYYLNEYIDRNQKAAE